MIWNLLLTITVISLTYLGLKIKKLKTAFNLLKKPCQFNEETDTKPIFQKALLPEKIDILVLGGGVSGLAAASTLAKLGKKVVVLEQSKKAGGGMHTFSKKGFVFDTGFHYIGTLDETQQILDLITSKKTEFNIFKTFDRIMLEDEVFDMSSPYSQFYENLLKIFPDQKIEIEKYRQLSKKVKTFFPFHLLNQFLIPSFLKVPFQKIVSKMFSSFYNKSVDEVLNNIGIKRNSKLYALLNANYGDLGSLPDKTPFALHVGLMSHYIKDGSLYPKEGLLETVKSIVSAINSNGGHVFTKARVDKILMNGSKVVGVEIQGGVVINCNTIISTIGRNNTIKCLPLDQTYIKPKVEKCSTNISVFLGVELEKNIFPTHNIWLHRLDKGKYDLFESRDAGLKDIEKMNMFFSFPTSKQNPDSKNQSVQIIAEVEEEQFTNYRINQSQRKPGYEEFKKKFEDICVQQFLKLFPECKDKIVYKSTGTPLSNEKYLGRFTIYGENVEVQKFFDLKQYFKFKQPIQGLYIAGQDVSYPSIVGAMFNGILVGLTVTNYL